LNDLAWWRLSGAYGDQERAILQFTEELTKMARVTDATAATVKSFLNDEGMVVLVSTIALAGFTNRFNNGLGVELEK